MMVEMKRALQKTKKAPATGRGFDHSDPAESELAVAPQHLRQRSPTRLLTEASVAPQRSNC